MKKRDLKNIKLNKRTITKLDTSKVFGGGTGVSYCNAGTVKVCCATN